MTRAVFFGAAITLGACLLFQIQFLLAKLMLPWFGGSPSVWSTALVVFQALLLAGYAYAHGIAALPTRRAQTRRHVLLCAIVLAALAWHAFAWPSPVTPGDAWKPDPDASPVRQIVALLTGAIGLPFVLLASTSPLLQRWFADALAHDGRRFVEDAGTGDEHGAGRRSPYRLYALSNLGSLLGLLSYPLLVEPRLDLHQQGRWWALAYVVYAAATLGCAWIMRAVPVHRDEAVATVGTRDDAPAPGDGLRAAAAAPSMTDHLLWLGLAAVPSALLQATTTRITQDIAAVPFLWMVPLALYLLTFIVAFEYPRFHLRHLWAAGVAIGTIGLFGEWSTRATLAWTLGALTVTGLGLHGELARRAPSPRWLTRFFLVVSAGGVLGSALTALGAPVAFDGIVEYPLTLAAALVLLAGLYILSARRATGIAAGLMRGAAVVLTSLGLGIVGHTVLEWRGLREDAVFTSRNFFGAIRVREQRFETGERYRRLQHGTTLHGMQYLEGEKRRQPVAYYTPSSGVGQAMSALAALGRPARIGVVGLGTGTLAAWGRPGDVFTFFEIDPQIVALSTAPTPLFTYLRESAARVEIVGGDARLSLEGAAPYGFDVLVLDAFSSDAVPVHLLTREAIAVYARHLRDAGSLLAIHVSNRYLDLEGVVQAAGAASGFTTVEVVQDLVDNDTERTTWMLLARDPQALRTFGEPRPSTGDAPWTDTSSNLLSVLRRE